MPTVNRIGLMLQAALFACLRTLLPTRFKRFIILTTIFKKGYDEKIFDNINFKNLNNRLHIANDIKAMENISMVTTKLWSGVELKELMQEAIHCNLNGECVSIQDASSLGEKIFLTLPAWLHYSRTKLVHDIETLFASERVHFTVGA